MAIVWLTHFQIVPDDVAPLASSRSEHHMLQSMFQETQSLSEMNSLCFDMHITGHVLAVTEAHRHHILHGAKHDATFPPQHASLCSPDRSQYATVFVGGDRNTGVWESSALDKYRGVGETLALDFPVPWMILWISCPWTALWWARAETCKTFSSNLSSNGDCFEVKTIHMRPGQNLNYRYNLNLFGMHNFESLGLHVV